MTSVHTEGKVTRSESFTCLDNATAVAYQLPGAACSCFRSQDICEEAVLLRIKGRSGYDHTELGMVTLKLNL